MKAFMNAIRQQGHITEAGNLRRPGGDPCWINSNGEPVWSEDYLPQSADPSDATEYYFDERMGCNACAHCGATYSDDDYENSSATSSECDRVSTPQAYQQFVGEPFTAAGNE